MLKIDNAKSNEKKYLIESYKQDVINVSVRNVKRRRSNYSSGIAAKKRNLFPAFACIYLINFKYNLFSLSTQSSQLLFSIREGFLALLLNSLQNARPKENVRSVSQPPVLMSFKNIVLCS